MNKIMSEQNANAADECSGVGAGGKLFHPTTAQGAFLLLRDQDLRAGLADDVVSAGVQHATPRRAQAGDALARLQLRLWLPLLTRRYVVYNE